MDLSSGTAIIPPVKYTKCIKCGSEKTHKSRVRAGERVLGNLFLRPIRCRQCKERFWVGNPNAYLALGGSLTIGALLIALVWLVIEHNLADPYVAPASKIETENPEVMGAGKSSLSPDSMPNPPTLGARPPDITQSAAIPAPGTKPTASARNPAEDHRFTVRLYQDSAENGDMNAQYQLGLLYLTGNGALQDFPEAAKWLKLAAEQGYGLAQYELGMIYRSGYGLPTDHVQSYVWLNLAAAAGVQQAVTARDEVMRSLSSKQLAQAQKISREWLAARPKPEITRGTGQTEREAAPGVSSDSRAR